MGKLILTDKTEIEVKPGATLSNITAVAQDFQELGTIADALMVNGNLDVLQFTSDDVVTGEYTNMKLISPLFRDVDIQDDCIAASFSVREKTELEKLKDKTEAEQRLQDGAIQEIGEMLSNLLEGGTA